MREHDLLATCLRKDNLGEKIAILEKLSPSDWGDLVEQSADHGVTPCSIINCSPFQITSTFPFASKKDYGKYTSFLPPGTCGSFMN